MAEVIADPDFAYGSVGLEESGIPANAAVTVTVELVAVQERTVVILNSLSIPPANSLLGILNRMLANIPGFGKRGRDVPRAPHVDGAEKEGQGQLLVLSRGVHPGDTELQVGH